MMTNDAVGQQIVTQDAVAAVQRVGPVLSGELVLAGISGEAILARAAVEKSSTRSTQEVQVNRVDDNA